MGFNLEEMAGKFGIDADTIKKAAETGDISGAMDSMTDALSDKGIDIEKIKSMIPDLDMDMLKDMLKDVDLKDISPDMLKDMAEKLMSSGK
ncbi:MAG: hypothetical protein E7505_07685 [Ruminococcus sp.]|jgi:hypothetical protein|nr:hypothetical protein [Ruminococcus sp.]